MLTVGGRWPWWVYGRGALRWRWPYILDDDFLWVGAGAVLVDMVGTRVLVFWE